MATSFAMAAETQGCDTDEKERHAAMMGGGNPDAEQSIQSLVKGFESAAKDAQSLTVGLTMAKPGVSMDMAVHFKEGSESGKMFTHKGGVGAVMVVTVPRANADDALLEAAYGAKLR